MNLFSLKEIFDNIPDGVSVIDSDMRIEWVNKALHDKGFHFDGVKGKKCYAIYKQRDKLCKNCPALKALLSKKTIRIEERGADGKHYEVTAVPIIKNGKVGKVMEIVRELQKKKPFAVSVGSVPGILVFVVNSKGKFVAMNKNAEKITGYEEKDIIGTRFTRIIQKDQVEKFRDTYSQIIRGHCFPMFKTNFMAKKGSIVPVEVSCHPFHSDGILLGVEIIAREASKPKKAKKPKPLKKTKKKSKRGK